MLKKIRSGISRRPSTDQAPPAPTAAAAAPPPPIAESVGSSGYLVDGAVAPRRPTAEVRTIPTLPGVSTIPVHNPDVAGSPGLETITDSTNSTPAVPAADATISGSFDRKSAAQLYMGCAQFGYFVSTFVRGVVLESDDAEGVANALGGTGY